MNQDIVANEVDDREILARFIFYRKHLRSDLSVKPDAFIPPSNLELSVVKHNNLTESNLWEISEKISVNRLQGTLCGRADFEAKIPRSIELEVKHDPLPDINEHCVIIGWPSDKPTQKIKAMEIARSVRYLSKP